MLDFNWLTWIRAINETNWVLFFAENSINIVNRTQQTQGLQRWSNRIGEVRFGENSFSFQEVSIMRWLLNTDLENGSMHAYYNIHAVRPWNNCTDILRITDSDLEGPLKCLILCHFHLCCIWTSSIKIFLDKRLRSIENSCLCCTENA